MSNDNVVSLAAPAEVSDPLTDLLRTGARRLIQAAAEPLAHHAGVLATEVRDAKGKVRRRYRRQDVATPYEKLKSLPDAARFLKPGTTFAALDPVAHAMSDLDANRRANRARDELFRTIGRAVPTAA